MNSRKAFSLLALPFNGDIARWIDAVFSENIVEGVFRRGALATGINGLTAQVLSRLHAVAIFNNVEHAERIDGQNLHAAVGIVIEHRSQIGWHGRDVCFPLDQRCRNLISSSRDAEIIIVVGEFAALRIVHKFHHAHRSRSFQRHDVDIHRIGCFFSGARLIGSSAARSRRV